MTWKSKSEKYKFVPSTTISEGEPKETSPQLVWEDKFEPWEPVPHIVVTCPVATTSYQNNIYKKLTLNCQ